MAALITGLLLSISFQQVGLPYLVIFIIAGLFTALFTEPRGLFLTVVSLPLLFGVMTPVAAWSVARSLAAEGTPAFSMATIATSVYPLIQFFPVLLAVTLGAGIIAALRLWLLKRAQRAQARVVQRARRRSAEVERRNRAAASRARHRTNQVTVEELLARNRQRAAPTERPVRRTPRRARPPAES